MTENQEDFWMIALIVAVSIAMALMLNSCAGTKHDTGWIAECKCLDCSFKCSRDYERTKIELEK